MKLYFGTGACSMAPHIALYEAGLKFETELVDLRTKQYKGGDFKKVNELGYVPVLELDNGERLTEAAVILQYIADQKPESGLMPKQGSMARYRALEWLNFIATELHKGFGPLWNPATPEEMREATKSRLGTRFDHVEKALSRQPYLMGDQVTVCDAYLFTMLSWASFHKIDLSGWKSILGFMERVSARPAVQSTLRAEGFIK